MVFVTVKIVISKTVRLFTTTAKVLEVRESGVVRKVKKRF